MATAANDVGRMQDDATVNGAALVFARTDAQRADLDALIAAQHDPASPLYHRWLTPEQFAARFGPSDADLAAATAWLESRGLRVDGVSRSRDRLRFSGTAGRIGAAFGTELHHYQAGGRLAFAPSSDLTLPTALAGAVRAVGNLHGFRPQSHLKPRPAPEFTSGVSGNNFLSPADVATIYDLHTTYAAGIDGTGQSIAVVGQSAIVVDDVESFQRAAGVRVHDPVQILVPNTGAAFLSSGDWAEGDLDVEYTSSIAPGAVVYYVFTGDSQNNSGAFDSLQYAVDNDLAQIISSSFGTCETSLSAADYASLEGIMSQAAAQGQTVLSASGDTGSTDCFGNTFVTAAQQKALAVDYPASSAFVTGVGGTEITSTAAANGSPFWTKITGTDVLSSAKSYMPEEVWNDDGATGILASGGGGISALTARPSWQTGVPGIPSGTKRFVPDLSLAASPANAPYLYCSSDVGQTSRDGSCSHGFRDVNNDLLTVAGGTSFSTPVFAGMLALLEQKLSAGGQGLVAATLYGIGSDPAKYASAFHDITLGGNQCLAGTTVCTVTTTQNFLANAGYDPASGLGSVDFANLVAAWPAVPATLAPSTVTISPANPSPLVGTSDLLTVTVASASAASTATPTGSVLISVDGEPVVATLTVSAAGSATYTFSGNAGGTHTVAATYSGDTKYQPSQASVPLAVQGRNFSLTATDATLAVGATATSTVTVTPLNGYTGTVAWSVTAAPSLSQGCFSIANTTVPSAAPVQTQLTIDADSAVCGVAARATPGHGQLASRWPGRPLSLLFGLGFAGLVGSGALRRRRWIGLLAIAVCAAGFVACGTSGPPASAQLTVKGAHTVTITGTDTNDTTITASTTLQLTIQ
jgi:subtilase family serine protease